MDRNSFDAEILRRDLRFAGNRRVLVAGEREELLDHVGAGLERCELCHERHNADCDQGKSGFYE